MEDLRSRVAIVAGGFVFGLLVSTVSPSAGATIEGIVHLDRTRFVPHVEVTAANTESHSWRRASSDHNGMFRLSDLPPGVYEIEARLRSVVLAAGTVEVDGGYAFLRIVPGEAIQPSGGVQGTVVGEGDREGLVVSLTGSQTGLARSATTDAYGDFEMAAVASGEYALRLERAEETLVEATLELGWGEELLHIDLDEGTVQRQEGPGILCVLLDDRQGPFTVTFTNAETGTERSAVGEGYSGLELGFPPTGLYLVRVELGEEVLLEQAVLHDESFGAFLEIEPGAGIREPHLVEASREGDGDMPEFPWPPPQASASVIVPRALLAGEEAVSQLQDVAGLLEAALSQAGYGRWSWYAVPDGFALVSQLEQINADGTPKEAPARWAGEPEPPPVFSLRSYIEALFAARPGFFRIIAFLVTPHAFTQSAESITREEAEAWLPGGTNVLPSGIGELLFSEEHACTALVYEFEQVTAEEEPVLKPQSLITGRQHLERAGIWSRLQE